MQGFRTQSLQFVKEQGFKPIPVLLASEFNQAMNYTKNEVVCSIYFTSTFYEILQTSLTQISFYCK
jgi:hypothetical protein